MSWQRWLKFGVLGLVPTVWMLSTFEKAIAQPQWSEEDVLPINTVDVKGQLPLRYQPIPQELIRLGKALETMKYRWQSSQLTYQAQQTLEQNSANFQKSRPVAAPNFLDKMQRKIDAYYYFLEAREFELATAEAEEIGQLFGEAHLEI